MLRRSLARFGGHGHGHGPPAGLNIKERFPHGAPKGKPFQEGLKHPALAPHPGGVWISKVAIGIPMAPFTLYFWRSGVVMMVTLIAIDNTVGIPGWMFMQKEKAPGKPSHYFFGNNGGIPHHFWCYQDGWSIPNESGVRRIME
eukprot:PhM_4_TR11038/c0_g1_i1/m.31452